MRLGRPFLGFLVLVLLAGVLLYAHRPPHRADIAVYGAGLAGCAAAWKAAATAPQKKVCIIVPYPERLYGGLATVGGQNYWDIRGWRGDLPQGGSFRRWFEATGPYYSPASLASLIEEDLGKLPNLETLWAMDVTGVQKDRQGRIKALCLRSLKRD